MFNILFGFVIGVAVAHFGVKTILAYIKSKIAPGK